MKKTKFILSRLLSGLGFWVFCLMMFSNVNSASAQVSGPLPSFKPRSEALVIVNFELEQIMDQIRTYGTTNRPQGNPAYDRLMKLLEAYKGVMDLLNNPENSVEGAVTSVYPILAVPNPNSSSMVNLNGFHSGNWPSDFADLVNKLKS
jgi:hypothetical protein